MSFCFIKTDKGKKKPKLSLKQISAAEVHSASRPLDVSVVIGFATQDSQQNTVTGKIL